MAKPLRALYLAPAKKYIEGVPDADKGAIERDVEQVTKNGTGIHTKQLKGPIRELIVGHHRVTYFKLGDTLYFIRGFRKKSAKTPKREIDYAHKIFTLLNSK